MTAAGGDTQHGIRRRNLARVLRTVAAQGPLSRPAVAARIGLTRAGVAPLVDELLRAGLLVEAGRAATGGRGRPGGELAVSDRGPAGLGAEIGVDHLAVCAVDLRGRVRARLAADAANRHSAPGPVLRRLSALLAEVTDAIAAEGLRPAGLAVAVPGLVARGATTVVHAPNLGWRAADLAPGLAGATAPRDGSPALPLTVENEANLGALAELRLGGGGGRPGPPPDFVHVSAEIGIGAAVVVDGQLLRGHGGSRGSWGMCRCIRTARCAAAAAGAAWSSTPARRPCCVRAGSPPGRRRPLIRGRVPVSACWRAVPPTGTRPSCGRCTRRGRRSVSRSPGR